MKRRLFALGALACFAAGSIILGCTNDAPKMTVLRVGATPVPHAQILRVAAKLLANEGIDLQVIEFNDYVQPNLALADKELDANFFQHKTYLSHFTKAHKVKLEPLAAVHIEPMGVYSVKHASARNMKKGATVALPSDAVNLARALNLLAEAGLVGLKGGEGLADVNENPRALRFVTMAPEKLPYALADVDFAVINANFALQAGLHPGHALYAEAIDSPYANVLAIRAGDHREVLQKLSVALNSAEVRAFILEHFKGELVPAF